MQDGYCVVHVHISRYTNLEAADFTVAFVDFPGDDCGLDATREGPPERKAPFVRSFSVTSTPELFCLGSPTTFFIYFLADDV